MAVTATPKGVSVQIKYAGDVVNGKQTYISKTYSRIKSVAKNEDIYNVAKAISGLQSKTLYSVVTDRDTDLKEV